MSGKRYVNFKREISSEEDSRDTSFDNFDEPLTNHEKQVRSYSSQEIHRQERSCSKRPCLNRNALLARVNRLRKKEYLQKIEDKLVLYQRENKSLSNVIQRQGISIKRLNGEVAYLKSILNNNTSITTLLKTMNEGLSRQSKQKLKASMCLSDQAELGNPKSNSDIIQTWLDRSDSLKVNNGSFDKKENVPEPEGFNDVCISGKEECRSVSPDCINKNRIYSNLSKVNIDNKEARWKFPVARKTAHSFLNFDHTYTMYQDNLTGNDFGNWSDIAESKNIESSLIVSEDHNKFDYCMGNGEMKNFNDLLPVESINTSSSDDKIDINSIDTDFNELSKLDMDIFNNLTKFDDISNSLELQNTSNMFNEENLFEDLGNSGICLHINSGKVSLEFCSICHVNSINSEIE